MHLILFLVLSQLNLGRIELEGILLFLYFGGGCELEDVDLKCVYDGYCYDGGCGDGFEAFYHCFVTTGV